MSVLMVAEIEYEKLKLARLRDILDQIAHGDDEDLTMAELRAKINLRKRMEKKRD